MTFLQPGGFRLPTPYIRIHVNLPWPNWGVQPPRAAQRAPGRRMVLNGSPRLSRNGLSHTPMSEAIKRGLK